MERLQFTKILIASLVCLLPVVLSAWQPPGKYDISMGELDPLCSMVKEYADTGNPPEPKPFNPKAGEGSDCIYFKWVTCPQPGDPGKPCGWYEMTKCGSNRKKRSDGLFDFEEESFVNRTKRDAIHDSYDGPVMIGFPDADQMHQINNPET